MPVIPQYPVQQQFIINPAAPFQNPYIINQIQIPQQIPNMHSIIANQANCGFAQFPMQMNNLHMQQGFPFQQPSLPAPIPSANSSNFNLTVTASTGNTARETRKVLINPHFKGRINVQEGYDRRKLDDIELLRQQEEFINQNRKNLQKRMQTSPRYSERESPDIDYRPPLKSRYSHSKYHYRKNYDSRDDSSSPVESHKRSPVTIEKIIEDKETIEYRKRVEEQRKKREMFLKQKEEKRKRRMLKDDMEVDSTVKEPLEKPEKENELHLNDIKLKEESIHNRLNKPVHLTGVLNLRTGLIKPKSKDTEIKKAEMDSASPTKVQIAIDSSKNSDNKILNTTKSTNIRKDSIQEMQNNILISQSNPTTSSIVPEEEEASSVEKDVKREKENSITPKAGFLGRRLVIASNMSKHNIVVQADNCETVEKKSISNQASGLFSKVIVNQEFSDDDDLSFLDESF